MDDIDFAFIQVESRYLEKLITGKNMEKKFLTGDIVINCSGILYMIVYEDPKPGMPVFAGKIWDGKYPEGTVPGIRLKYDFNPDRRFMSVRSTKTVIGQFKVWFIKESELVLHRRIMPEKTPDFIGPDNIVRDLNTAIIKFNSGNYPLIANTIVISENGFKELCEYYSTRGGPLQKTHPISDIKFRELTVYRSQDMKKEQFIILSNGQR